MPKVGVSNSKGLVQEAGSGFELSDSHVKPASETILNASTIFDCTTVDADVGGTAHGLYFDISSTDTLYRVYFDTAGDGSGEPDDLAGRTAVMADVSGGGATNTAINRAGAIATALGALGDFAADATSAAGLCTVFVLTPGALAESFDAGTSGDGGVLGAVVATETDGSGQAALTVDKRVSVLGQTAANTGDAELTGNVQVTLGAGAYAGQEKVILLDGVGTENQTVTLTGYTSAADNGLAALTATFTHANNEACNIHLLWDGAGWAALSINGNVAVA